MPTGAAVKRYFTYCRITRLETKHVFGKIIETEELDVNSWIGSLHLLLRQKYNMKYEKMTLFPSTGNANSTCKIQ